METDHVPTYCLIILRIVLFFLAQSTSIPLVQGARKQLLQRPTILSQRSVEEMNIITDGYIAPRPVYLRFLFFLGDFDGDRVGSPSPSLDTTLWGRPVPGGVSPPRGFSGIDVGAGRPWT